MHWVQWVRFIEAARSFCLWGGVATARCWMRPGACSSFPAETGPLLRKRTVSHNNGLVSKGERDKSAAMVSFQRRWLLGARQQKARVCMGTGLQTQMVPPTGFEPVISTLKGWRPWPLDDGDTAEKSIAETAPFAIACREKPVGAKTSHKRSPSNVPSGQPKTRGAARNPRRCRGCPLPFRPKGRNQVCPR